MRLGFDGAWNVHLDPVSLHRRSDAAPIAELGAVAIRLPLGRWITGCALPASLHVAHLHLHARQNAAGAWEVLPPAPPGPQAPPAAPFHLASLPPSLAPRPDLPCAFAADDVSVAAYPISGDALTAQWRRIDVVLREAQGAWCMEAGAAAAAGAWPGEVGVTLDADPSSDTLQAEVRFACADPGRALCLAPALPAGLRFDGGVQGSARVSVRLPSLPNFEATLDLRGEGGALALVGLPEPSRYGAWELALEAAGRGDALEIGGLRARGGVDLPGQRTVRAELDAAGAVLPTPHGHAALRLELAAAGTVVAAHAELEASADGTFNASAQVDPVDAAALQPWADLAPGGVRLDGRAEASARVAGSLRPAALRSAALRIEAPAATLPVSEFLGQPVCVRAAPLVLEWDGASGSLAPWAIEAGPLQVATQRVAVTAEGGSLAFSGAVMLAPFAVRDILARAGPRMEAIVRGFRRDLESLAVAGAEARFDAALRLGEDGPAFASAHIDADARLALGGGPVPVRATLAADAMSQRVRLALEVPEFVEADWDVPFLRELPVPALDAPTSLRIDAVAHLDGTPETARWRLETGAGHLVPHGPLLRWLVGPLPLTRFAAGGRIDGALERAVLDDLSLQMGRGTLAFTRGELELPAIDGEGARAVRLRFAWEAGDWYIEDFLALLSAEARALAPDELPPGRNGLRHLRAEADAAAVIGADGALTLTGFDSAHEGALCIGGADLPLVIRTGINPELGELVTRVELPEFVPAALGLPPPPFAPVAPGDFDLPVSAVMLVRLPLPRRMPGAFGAPVVEVTWHAGPGHVHACSWLGAETPVRDAVFEARLELAPLALREVAARLDFGGPLVELRNASAAFGDTIDGSAEVVATAFDLAWVQERIPPALLSPALAQTLARVQVRGRIDEARLEARVALDPAHPEAALADPQVTAGLWLSELDASWDGTPLGSVASLRLAAAGDSVRVEATDLASGPARLLHASLEASNLLHSEPALTAEVEGLVLDPWIRGAGASLALRAHGGLRGAPWSVDVALDATAASYALAPLLWSRAAGVPAGMRLHAEGPPVPEGRVLPGSLAFTAEAWGVPGGRCSAEGGVELDAAGLPRRLDVSRWQAGSAAGSAHAALPTSGPLEIAVEVETLDVPVWVREFEPWLAQVNAALSQPASPPPPPAAGVVVAAVPPQAPAPWGLPDVRARLGAAWVDLGEGHALARVAGAFDASGGWPTAFDLEFQADGAANAVRWRADEAGALHVTLGDLGKLVGVAAAPLAALQPASVPPGSLFDSLRVLPVTLQGGALEMRGAWRPTQAEAWLEGACAVTGLRLERDIASLSRIAALAKRRVILFVPFERLGAERFVVGASGVQVANAVLGGPVDITFERINYRAVDTVVDVRGKVFGLCFEVTGPAASPSFYLCDDSSLIQAITEEDEW